MADPTPSHLIGKPVESTAAPTISDPVYKPRGGASTFDASKYNIDQFQYPSDLMGSSGEYGANYVVFYINVATDSKLIKDGTEETVSDIPPRDQGSIVGLATNNVPQVTNYFANLAGTSETGVNAAEAIKGIGAQLTGQKKRIKSAIALHIPNNLATSYNITYDEDDTQLAALALAAAGGTAALAKAAKQGGLSNVADTAKGQTSAVAAALGATALNLSNTAQKLTGYAPNPRKEQFFKNVQFRTFTFEYEFFPRDAFESQNVLNIIYQFKLHMHPEFKDANQFLYVYPSEFDIFYYNNGKENMNINRHTSCVLTSMNVNYTPNGQFTTFEGGMPTQINVSLTFMELATLTKEKIQDGL